MQKGIRAEIMKKSSLGTCFFETKLGQNETISKDVLHFFKWKIKNFHFNREIFGIFFFSSFQYSFLIELIVIKCVGDWIRT